MPCLHMCMHLDKALQKRLSRYCFLPSVLLVTHQVVMVTFLVSQRSILVFKNAVTSPYYTILYIPTTNIDIIVHAQYTIVCKLYAKLCHVCTCACIWIRLCNENGSLLLKYMYIFYKTHAYAGLSGRGHMRMYIRDNVTV